MFFFFFQAEDGIRDLTVTGVQTCALPILCDLGFGSYGIRAPMALDVLDTEVRQDGDTFRLSLDDQGEYLLRSEEHTSELQSQSNLVCRLLLEKKKHRPQTSMNRSRRQYDETVTT